MAVYHRAYLFDADRCRVILRPLVHELLAGRSKALQDKATELGTTNADVWQLLRDYRLYMDDLGHEDKEFDTRDQRIRYWLMIVLASFWQPLETPRDYARLVRDAILPAENDDQFVELLTLGRPVFSLIVELLGGHNLEFSAELTSWCKPGLMGWLSFGDVDAQLQRLNKLQPYFSQNPESLRSVGYLAAIRLLTRASQEVSGLFMAVTD